MGIRGYAFDGDFLILGSAKINIRNIKHWDKDHVLTDFLILKKTDTTFKKIGAVTYANNGTIAINLDRTGERITWKWKKWKRQALKVLKEQIAHGCFNEDNFNDLVVCLINAKSKKDYVENYWIIVEKENLNVAPSPRISY